MHAPEVLHRSLQLGDGDGQHTVLNIQLLDLVIKKSPDGTECSAHLVVPLYLPRPEYLSVDRFLGHIG